MCLLETLVSIALVGLLQNYAKQTWNFKEFPATISYVYPFKSLTHLSIRLSHKASQVFCFRTHCLQNKTFEKRCMNLRKTVHMLKWARLNIPISEEQLNYHFCSFRKLKGGQKLISQNLEVRLTVAVWTQKTFFPLLIRPQGSQGCQKITFFFLQMKVFSFCAKIALKLYKLQKTVKIEEKSSKKPCFHRHFRIFFNLGAILAHQTSCGMFNGSWPIF